MIRVLSLCAGLCGAGVLSQYPEFAQQYVQRLAGQVDALDVIVADFDQSALDAGLTRSQALAQLSGTAFLDARQADMQTTFARHTALTTALDQLRSATEMERLALFHRMNDAEILRNTWADFAPAVPITTAGLASAAAGFLGGWAGLGVILSVFARPFRRRRTKPAKSDQDSIRRDPPIRRPHQNVSQAPRLMGETRP